MPTTLCPFCKEEIQAEAVVCRFCRAEKSAIGWRMPKHGEAPGMKVIRGSGWLMLLSGAFECYSITSPIPLFGQLRAGAIASVFHFAFAAMFFLTGAGLIKLRYWGYQSLMLMTAVYTAERVLYLFDTKARAAEFQNTIGAFAEMLSPQDVDAAEGSVQMFAVVILLSWWAFAWYVHYRRKIFQR